MDSNHVRDLMEAYISIYAENQEVEQLDEFAPRLQAPVNNFLKTGQKILGDMGLPINKTQRPTVTGSQQKLNIKKEQVDLYDIILSHLLDEGYAETQESAEAIMVNMSEGWRENIVESARRPPGVPGNRFEYGQTHGRPLLTPQSTQISSQAANASDTYQKGPKRNPKNQRKRDRQVLSGIRGASEQEIARARGRLGISQDAGRRVGPPEV